jgi:hypothetical protein
VPVARYQATASTAANAPTMNGSECSDKDYRAVEAWSSHLCRILRQQHLRLRIEKVLWSMIRFPRVY